MKEQVIPYGLALELKELGFDDMTLGVYYINDNDKEVIVSMPPYVYGKGHGIYKKHNVLVPLWQQAFDWFREEHTLHSYIERYDDDTFDYTISSKVFVEEIDYGDGPFELYRDAQVACLDRLIQIVKNKK
jgi:hypothetical protein